MKILNDILDLCIRKSDSTVFYEFQFYRNDYNENMLCITKVNPRAIAFDLRFSEEEFEEALKLMENE